MRNPVSRIAMLDGFNEGWIEFEHAELSLKGCVSVETVIRDLVHAHSEDASSADPVARG